MSNETNLEKLKQLIVSEVRAQLAKQLAAGELVIDVVRVAEDVPLPVYATAGANCFDLHAYVPAGKQSTADGFTESDPVEMLPSMVVRSGLKFNIPEGHTMLLFPRSGLAFNKAIRLANGVGVIDSDFVGEVKMKLVSDKGSDFTVSDGDRIAQAMIVPVPRVTFNVVTGTKVTERGECGLGHSGTAPIHYDMAGQQFSIRED